MMQVRKTLGHTPRAMFFVLVVFVDGFSAGLLVQTIGTNVLLPLGFAVLLAGSAWGTIKSFSWQYDSAQQLQVPPRWQLVVFAVMLATLAFLAIVFSQGL